MAGTGPWLTVVTVLVLVLLAGPNLLARRHSPWAGKLLRLRPLLIFATLMLIIVGKFLTLDAPLARLENVILEVRSTQPEGQKRGGAFLERLKAGDSAPIGGYVARRAEDIWLILVCSRIGPTEPNQVNAAPCDGKLRDGSRADLEGLFRAQLWAAALVIALAVTALREGTGGRAGASVAVLTLVYLLTVPYAHGKLMRSSFFDYGRVRLTTSLAAARHGPASNSAPSAQPSGAGSEAVQPDRYGLILARSAAGTDLLTVVEDACPGGRSNRRVAMWSVAASQLLAVEEIYRQDVLTWSVLNTLPCPPAPSPHEYPKTGASQR